jgi:hypothetical protein
MIGLSSSRLRSAVRAFSRLSCVVVPIGIAALSTMFASVGFGLVFNYTHSVAIRNLSRNCRSREYATQSSNICVFLSQMSAGRR